MSTHRDPDVCLAEGVGDNQDGTSCHWFSIPLAYVVVLSPQSSVLV